MDGGLIKLGRKKQPSFMDDVIQLLPESGNLNLCLTCGACSSGCPASGLEGMDPRKFLRLAALGLDDEILGSNWVWMCTMCQRCVYVCPMKIDIPRLVYNARSRWPREKRPKGILGSCNMALRNDSGSAMGTSPEDFQFVVEDVLEEYRASQPEFTDMRAPIDKMGAEFFLNQNSREPVTGAGRNGASLEDPSSCRRRLDLWIQGLGRGELLHVPRRQRCLETYDRCNRSTSGGLGVQGFSQYRVRSRHLLSPGRTEKVQHSAFLCRQKHLRILCHVDPPRAARSTPTGTGS